MNLAARKPTSFRDVKLIDGIMSGEAGRIAGCDGRTFKAWAKKLKIEPAMVVKSAKGDKVFYKRVDAERVARAYKAFQEQQRLARGI